MRKIVGVALILASAGCATTSPYPDPNTLTRSIGDLFVGRHVQDVAAMYGAPHSQQDLHGQKIYSWNANTTLHWRRSVQSNTSGSIGDQNRYPYFRDVPYRQTTTTDQYVPTNYHCRLDVYVDDGGIVRNLGLFGKMGACNEFNPYR